VEKLTTLEFIKKFLSGAIIGIGAIIPGVSGGVLAVSMGLYEKMLDAISNFFRSPRENIIFMFPIGLGAVFCIYGLSGVVAWSMQNYGSQVLFLFIGLVMGSIPSLVKKANDHGFKARYLCMAALGLVLILSLEYMELIAPTIKTGGELDFYTSMVCGAVLSVGTIVPGISTSFILIYLGTYEIIMQSIHTLNITALIPLGIGFAATSVVIVKIVNYLFKNFHAYSYYAVLGLLIGSIVLILPDVRFDVTLGFNIVLFVTGVSLQLLLEKL